MNSKTVLASVALLLIAASAAGAQRQCKKGIPCGGTCISATKTCHVGTTQPSPEPDTAIHRVMPAQSEQQALVDRITGPSSAARYFVGSVDGNVYYAGGCATAILKITEDEKVVFLTEREAIEKGYHRSKAKGC
jgi:hypothetical protein